METALFLSDAKHAERLAKRVRAAGWRSLLLDAGFRTGFERVAYENLLRAVGPALDAAPFVRLYVGNEACEHLGADARTLDRLLAVTERLGLGLGLVLPPTYATREADVQDLLARLSASGRSDLEVVCAEWGTVALVHEHPALTPVLGRTLGRMKRFVRWSLQGATPDMSALEGVGVDDVQAAQVRVQSLPAFALDEQRDLARSLGVSRAALDPVPQGISWQPDPSFSVSLHVPWTYVTLGRHCVLRATVEGSSRVDHDAPCRRWCRDRYALADYDPPTVPVVHKGNAVYMENVSFLPAVASGLRDGARWIVSPFP